MFMELTLKQTDGGKNVARLNLLYRMDVRFEYKYDTSQLFRGKSAIQRFLVRRDRASRGVINANERRKPKMGK